MVGEPDAHRRKGGVEKGDDERKHAGVGVERERAVDVAVLEERVVAVVVQVAVVLDEVEHHSVEKVPAHDEAHEEESDGDGDGGDKLVLLALLLVRHHRSVHPRAVHELQAHGRRAVRVGLRRLRLGKVLHLPAVGELRLLRGPALHHGGGPHAQHRPVHKHHRVVVSIVEALRLLRVVLNHRVVLGRDELNPERDDAGDGRGKEPVGIVRQEPKVKAVLEPKVVARHLQTFEHVVLRVAKVVEQLLLPVRARRQRPHVPVLLQITARLHVVEHHKVVHHFVFFVVRDGDAGAQRLAGGFLHGGGALEQRFVRGRSLDDVEHQRLALRER
mmetsp:Transcript_19877/g.64682  ORF Transcript_19877/g.64682 Transcript_19877/m.64682 type:complete len:330 (+) Transcript_19877:2082-3071(+)